MDCFFWTVSQRLQSDATKLAPSRTFFFLVVFRPKFPNFHDFSGKIDKKCPIKWPENKNLKIWLFMSLDIHNISPKNLLGPRKVLQKFSKSQFFGFPYKTPKVSAWVPTSTQDKFPVWTWSKDLINGGSGFFRKIDNRGEGRTSIPNLRVLQPSQFLKYLNTAQKVSNGFLIFYGGLCSFCG